LVSWIVEVDDVVWSRVDGAKTGPSMAGGRPGGSSHPLATAATAPARYALANPPIGGGPSSGSAATRASAIAETNAE
jgi:hypothetical protein